MSTSAEPPDGRDADPEPSTTRPANPRARWFRPDRHLRELIASLVAEDAPLDMRLVGRTLLHAALVGLAAGLVGVGFFVVLEYTQYGLLELGAGYLPLRAHGEDLIGHASSSSFRWGLLIALPALGALAAGLLSRMCREVRGGGGDTMIEAFHHKDGDIPQRVIWFKPIASWLTLGTGGSGGREGPTMLIGGALGALAGRLLAVSARERRILMLAGVAGGIAAVFRTPLGAALLAIEILYQDDFEPDALIPAVLASVVAYSVSISLFGQSTLFGKLPTFAFHPRHLPLYLGFALVIAVLGWIFVGSLAVVRRASARLPGPEWIRPALGGLALGVIAVAAIVVLSDRMGGPGHGLGILGGGYGAAQIAMTGASWLPQGWDGASLLAVLCLLKIAGTALTIGTGGSAGDFAPSIAIGGMAGGAFGLAARALFHDPSIDPGAFALIGMGAFYGSIAHVPLAALVLTCEMAGSYDLLVPTMMAVGIALLAMRRHTLYPAQVRSSADSPVHRARRDLLSQLRVAEIMPERPVVCFTPQTPAREVAIRIAAAADQDVFPVVDAGGILRGMIRSDAVRLLAANRDLDGVTVASDLMSAAATVLGSDTLRRAATLLLERDCRELIVLGREGAIVGLLDEHDVSRAHLERARPTTLPGADRA